MSFDANDVVTGVDGIPRQILSGNRLVDAGTLLAIAAGKSAA